MGHAQDRQNPSTKEGKWAQSPSPRQEAVHKLQQLTEGKSVSFNEVTLGISTTLQADSMLMGSWPAQIRLHACQWIFLFFLFLKERKTMNWGRKRARMAWEQGMEKKMIKYCMKFSKNKFENGDHYKCTCKGRRKRLKIPALKSIKKQEKCSYYKITIRRSPQFII